MTSAPIGGVLVSWLFRKSWQQTDIGANRELTLRMVEWIYLSDFLNLDVGWVLDAQVAGHPLHDSLALCLNLYLEADAYSGGEEGNTHT